MMIEWQFLALNVHTIQSPLPRSATIYRTKLGSKCEFRTVVVDPSYPLIQYFISVGIVYHMLQTWCCMVMKISKVLGDPAFNVAATINNCVLLNSCKHIKRRQIPVSVNDVLFYWQLNTQTTHRNYAVSYINTTNNETRNH